VLARPLSCALCMMMVSAFAARGLAQGTEAQPEAVQTAQQAEQERAMSVMDDEARQHFQIGKTLYDAGRFPEAATEFEKAYEKSGRPQLLYNLYVANRDASNWAAAIAALRGYLEKVPDAPDRINLKARLQSMEAASAAREAEQQAKADEEPERREQTDVAPTTRTEKVRSVVPLVLMGAGGALVLGGAVTGFLTKSKTDDLDGTCDGKGCPASESDNIDSAKTLALTTDVLFGVGIVTAGVGAVLFFTGALDSEREVPIANLSCGAHACGATLTGRF